MARFGVADADKYGGQGGGGYFSLKNDKDVARVRFMYDSIDDVEGFAVHEVEIDGKKRYVNCLRDYGQPMDACPFCKAGRFQQVKYFLQLYNVDEDRVQTWERGKKFGAKISSLCARYPHLVSHQFEIERNGKAGSMETTYEIYSVGDKDETTLDDLPEASPILGTLVLDKNVDDMNYYLDNGEFPGDGGDAPVTRRGGDRDSESRSDRRTPSNSGRREAF